MPDLEMQSISENFKIVLFARQNLIRESLHILLESKSNLRVVAGSGENTSLRDLVEKNQPDLVLLYLSDDDSKSVEKIPELQKSISEPYILVITKENDVANQNRALRLGAIKTLDVGIEAEELLETINQICRGNVLPEIKSITIPTAKNKLSSNETHPKDKIKTLTEREREIVGMVGEGLRSKEIATRLNISKATVRHHLSSVYDKLELKDKLNLVIFAHRHRLVKSFTDKI